MRIDFHFPVQTPERMALELRSWGSAAGYRGIFLERWCRQTGVTADAAERILCAKPSEALPLADHILTQYALDGAATADLLDRAELDKAVVHGPLVSDVPYGSEAFVKEVTSLDDRLLPFVRLNLDHPNDAALDLEHAVLELGAAGGTMTPFWHGRRTDDPAFGPIFDVAQSLGVPIWIHTSSQWRTDIPLELEHPLQIDRIATAYPDAKLVLGHGGWPWVLEAMITAWRHPNVYIDTSAFRPRNLFRVGSGWEPFVYYGERTIKRKIVLGTTWAMLGMSPQAAFDEAASEAPWPAEVVAGWLGDNAATLLDIDVELKV